MWLPGAAICQPTCYTLLGQPDPLSCLVLVISVWVKPTLVCLFVYSEPESHYGALAGLPSTFILLSWVSWWLNCSARPSGEMKNWAANWEDPLMVWETRFWVSASKWRQESMRSTPEHWKSSLSARGIFLQDFQQAAARRHSATDLFQVYIQVLRLTRINFSTIYWGKRCFPCY